MLEFLIVLMMKDMHVVVSASRLYGVTNMVECNQAIEKAKKPWQTLGIKDSYCLFGDINNDIRGS